MSSARRKPADLTVGDIVRVPAGPLSGRLVKVLTTPRANRHMIYEFAAELVEPVRVGIDYTYEVEMDHEVPRVAS